MKESAITVELQLPSRPGFEKVAMSTAESLAQLAGFEPSRIDDLKTALAEACINAMEHGNRWNPAQPVTLVFTVGEESLEIKVRDCGAGVGLTSVRRPDLAKKVRGEEEARGMGMFLIESLVDESEWVKDEAGGSYARLVMRLPAIAGGKDATL